jgi:tetratricopeptide (TPR) repeat protein
MLDGAYYLDWARDVLHGAGQPQGAYYLAPLYPWVLTGFIRFFGENFALLYLFQHASVLVVAAILAAIARDVAGELAGLSAAATLLSYHPVLFFSSRPVGETLATLFLLVSVWIANYSNSYTKREAAWLPAGSGFLAGVSSLARPNVLLVAAVWTLLKAIRRRWVAAVLVVAGTALALLPVFVRNLAASGHLVPISSNSGITLYHGNGPGAEGGFTRPAGFTGSVSSQRQEATELASRRTASDLDPVAADGWWAREALRERARDPMGTLYLFSRKLLLLFDNVEHGLDDAPALDMNPWRWGASLPFAAVVGLAAAGVAALGLRRSGGPVVWSAILACAAAPVVFYASSRYRLPAAALLCVPAGCGAKALLLGGSVDSPRRRIRAGIAGVAAAALSLLVPSSDLVRAETAGALANRAVAHKRLGDLVAAERDARRAMEIDPSSAIARFNLGTILETGGRAGDAEASYVEALSRDPESAEAAGNLAALLIRRGAWREAIPILEKALTVHPSQAACRANLVVALLAAGDLGGAREAASAAAKAGVVLDPELLRVLRPE